ncbi:MAG: sugar transferase [Candidatus Aminicenantes bacterium]|nr:MAG: sugar transferase [Candidatus Aminicenantes bacterium]
MYKVVEELVEKERYEAKKISLSKKKFSASLVREKLEKIYLKRCPGVFKFVDRVVDLDTVDILKAEVNDTGNPYNVEILPDNSLEFFMNLHTLNDYRRVNQYLIEVNRKLKDRAVFVGKFKPCEKRYIYFLKNYPHFLANALYFFDFTWKRVFPKLPFLKKVYFAVTKGRGRVFSMAEALGRLYFCGFEIVSLENVDHFVYFIVQKVKEPETDASPSYGLLFKQKRVGKDGKNIYIYKIRTMHPYSEYIHHYIYEKNKLDEKGKIKDDFRITAWGRVFRKLWIDEVPMLINWIKGDVKLVGVRPLSETFFNTYPENLQNERIQFKPGLVPPYYVDMPNSMEEVWESERNYLEKYKKHPIRTDMDYFFKAMKNILFHHTKSE